jgi:hypothetical protein
MFWKSSGNVIESTEGFSVRMSGRTELKYIEGDHVLSIDSEMLLSDSPFAIVSISRVQQWDPPYSDQLIDDLERKRITNNIREAFRSQGKEIEVV